MYNAISLTRSLVKRDALIYSADGGTTFASIPKTNLHYYATASGVQHVSPNNVNQYIPDRNLMILKGVDEETIYLKFDWKLSTIGGNSSATQKAALDNMALLTKESLLVSSESKTSGTYTLSKDYCTSITIIVNSGTITINGGPALAAATYSFNAEPNGYLGSMSVVLTGTASIIYQYLG
jgi:hypothetical protein